MIFFPYFCACLKNCFYLPYRNEGDSELKSEICSAIKFCYPLDKTTPEKVKLMIKAYKNKWFGESMIFRWQNDFKKCTFVYRTDS